VPNRRFNRADMVLDLLRVLLLLLLRLPMLPLLKEALWVGSPVVKKYEKVCCKLNKSKQKLSVKKNDSKYIF